MGSEPPGCRRRYFLNQEKRRNNLAKRHYNIRARFENVTIRLPFEGKSSYETTATRFDVLRHRIQQRAKCFHATAAGCANNDTRSEVQADRGGGAARMPGGVSCFLRLSAKTRIPISFATKLHRSDGSRRSCDSRRSQLSAPVPLSRRRSYPGDERTTSFVFLYEDGAWKLDDIYTFRGAFVQAESLSQYLREK